MTPDEFINHVRNSVNGVEVDASPRDTNLAMLRAGMTVAVIALSRLDEADREFQLEVLEENTRDTLARLAKATQRRLKFN